MGGYVGKLQIGNNSNNLIAFGDVLYGVCNTSASTAAKVVDAANFPTFDRLMDGIQIRVKFTAGNSVSSGVTLQIGTTTACAVQGNCECSTDDVISFTFEENPSATSYWRVTSGGVSSSIQTFVNNAISQMTGAVDSMVFKGTIGTSGATVSSLPSSGYKAGWTYKAISNDATNNYGLSTTTGSGQGRVEAGDLIIAITDASSGQSAFQQNHWTVVQSNLDNGLFKGTNSLTDTHVLIADGTGGQVKDSGFTIGTSVPADAVFTDTISTVSAGDGSGTVGLVEASNGVLIIHGIEVTTSSAST